MADFQQGNETTGQQPADSDQQVDATSEESTNDRYSGLPEDIQRELRSRDAEAAKFRKRAQAAEAEVQQFKQQGLSELEKRDARIRELEQTVEAATQRSRAATIQAEVTAAATALGFRNPSVAHRLIETDRLNFDGDRITNVSDLLKDVLRSDPYLAAPTKGADAGSGRNDTEPMSMTDRIRAAAGKGDR